MRQTNTSKTDHLITLTKINRVPSNNNQKKRINYSIERKIMYNS